MSSEFLKIRSKFEILSARLQRSALDHLGVVDFKPTAFGFLQHLLVSRYQRLRLCRIAVVEEPYWQDPRSPN